MVNSIIDAMKDKGFIRGKQATYLKGEGDPRERRFYILPKIHKDPGKWTIPNEVPPGRPIVSDCNSETYRTAEFIDYHLYPLSILHPSYVKDTYHFVEIVKNLKIPEDAIFFSMDVESLYTNIDIRSGIKAVWGMFQKHPKLGRPDEAILKLLKINLTRNDFMFDGEFYLQIKGTAMGKRFAPAYANIFMAAWEEEVFKKCGKRPLHYLRYLDDVWGIWTHTEGEFEEFMQILNTHDPSIKLKHVLNRESIDFLDTTVYKGDKFALENRLDIKVFFKETDTHALLFKSSFHPKHTFRGLIKSQLLRFQRICTQRDTFWEAVKILFRVLRKRGYSRSFLRQYLKTFRDPKKPNLPEIIPLITKYSTSNRVLHKNMKNNFEKFIVNRKILQDYRIVSAFQRHKNLKDILVTAALKPLHAKTRQQTGPFVILTFVKIMITKIMYRINQQFTFQSKNCVYMIFCYKCGKQYIGETKNSISTRMWQHRYNIIHKKRLEMPIVKHFILHGMQAVRVSGIQGNVSWTDLDRKKAERR